MFVPFEQTLRVCTVVAEFANNSVARPIGVPLRSITRQVRDATATFILD
jgi:hypothetical protein